MGLVYDDSIQSLFLLGTLGPWLAEHGVTVISTVPTLAAMRDDDALAEVRPVIPRGEPRPPEIAWRLATGREVWNTYGPTEATAVSTAKRVRPGAAVTIGWPLAGWEVAPINGRCGPTATRAEPACPPARLATLR